MSSIHDFFLKGYNLLQNDTLVLLNYDILAYAFHSVVVSEWPLPLHLHEFRELVLPACNTVTY